MYKSFGQRSMLDNSYFQNTSMLTEIRHYFKVIILGNIGVGKTAILNRFLNDEYIDKYSSTIGVDKKSKSIRLKDNTWADLQIWDTCGQERYQSITKQYCKNASGCIVVFDLTNEKSFEKVQKWIDDIRTVETDIVIILAGNKSDKDEDREVNFEKASSYAKDNRMDYFEVSAKDGLNIDFLFQILANAMSKQANEPENRENKKKHERSFQQIYKIDELKKIDKKKKNPCCV